MVANGQAGTHTQTHAHTHTHKHTETHMHTQELASQMNVNTWTLIEFRYV